MHVRQAASCSALCLARRFRASQSVCGRGRAAGSRCIHPRWAHRLNFEQRRETRAQLRVAHGIDPFVEKPPRDVVVHGVVESLYHLVRRRPRIVVVGAATLYLCRKVLRTLVAVVRNPHVTVKRLVGRPFEPVLRVRALSTILMAAREARSARGNANLRRAWRAAFRRRGSRSAASG